LIPDPDREKEEAVTCAEPSHATSAPEGHADEAHTAPLSKEQLRGLLNGFLDQLAAAQPAVPKFYLEAYRETLKSHPTVTLEEFMEGVLEARRDRPRSRQGSCAKLEMNGRPRPERTDR
jgi:hypothetical protein